MANNKDAQIVIALFESYEAGEQAAKALKSWDKANEEIQLGAIGLVRQTEKGKIKTKKYGPRNVGRGAKVGLVLGVLAAVLPAVTLVSGAVGGAAAGGFLGIFSKKGLGLKEEDLARLKAELAQGKAALVVLCDDEEVADTEAELESLGGQTSVYPSSAEDLEQAAQEVNAPPPDEIEGQPAAAAEE
jgi:uncharacterized membrane protein